MRRRTSTQLVAELRQKLAAAVAEATRPIPMRLPCPACGALHVDRGEWAARPHHTHACQKCGMVWRPAVPCTVGVQFLPGHRGVTETEIRGAMREVFRHSTTRPTWQREPM